MKREIDPTYASLTSAYRNLAQLWRIRADAAMEQRDAYGTHEAVKRAVECENAARRIEIRHMLP